MGSLMDEALEASEKMEEERANIRAQKAIDAHTYEARLAGQQVTFLGKELSKLNNDEMKQLYELIKNDPGLLHMPSRAADAMAMTAGRYNNPPPPSWDEMLRVRMRWSRLGAKEFISVDVRLAGGKVFVWIITNDFKSVVIEDSKDMFPSDQCVTQIRLLQG